MILSGNYFGTLGWGARCGNEETRHASHTGVNFCRAHWIPIAGLLQTARIFNTLGISILFSFWYWYPSSQFCTLGQMIGIAD